jgi:hypothetical protein
MLSALGRWNALDEARWWGHGKRWFTQHSMCSWVVDHRKNWFNNRGSLLMLQHQKGVYCNIWNHIGIYVGIGSEIQSFARGHDPGTWTRNSHNLTEQFLNIRETFAVINKWRRLHIFASHPQKTLQAELGNIQILNLLTCGIRSQSFYGTQCRNVFAVPSYFTQCQEVVSYRRHGTDHPRRWKLHIIRLG